MRCKRSLLTLSVLLTILALNGSNPRGEAAARINISPWGHANAPVDVEIVAHIDRNSSNRAAIITLASEDYQSDSTVVLDGDKAPFILRRTIRGLHEGRYQAFMELQRWEGKWKIEHFRSEVLEVH